MIKVVVITPYPELTEMARAALKDNANPGIVYEVTHAYGTNVDDLDIDSPDIIVARGLTQRALKARFRDATVLEFSVSAYDILRAVHECRKTHGAERIAILGIDTILYDVATLREIINVDMKIFPIANESDIHRSLAEARQQGFEAVVGGLTVFNIASRLGMANTFIKTSEESFRITINEAMSTACIMFTERAKTEINQAILQNSKEAILYFDHRARLAQYNRRARELLSLPPDASLVGQEVASIFHDQDSVDIVRSLGTRHGVIKTINNNALVGDFSAVRLEEQTIGVICTFQRINEIQDKESMIRKQLSKKGLVAKYGFSNIIHASDTLAQTIATANKYASSDANVLLIGETGTGKELFAQSIHLASHRRQRPFVAVNCASFPENLLESELFGYVEGAFSGASRGGKAGLFELAHNGTLFLDEIGEIPPSLQASLLRALQEHEIRRIGDDKVIPVNVRIIAATNRDLRGKVQEGNFRMDLLYRLDVLSLFIPPLRDRKVDTKLIAAHYLNHYCQKYQKPGITLGSKAMEVLTNYPWPGNTRELRNICERLAVLVDDDTKITAGVVSGLLHIGDELPSPLPLEQREPDLNEPRNVDEILEFAQSMRVNKSDIANMLGISRTTLWRRMKNKRLSQGK